MDDWEDEQLPPLVTKDQPKSKWDDEDVDDDDVKESWEDEDEPVTALAPVVKPSVDKASKKAAKKSSDVIRKSIEEPKQEQLDPVAEKLLQQRLVEEADFRSTMELFAKKGDGKTLENFIPKSEGDLMEYAEIVAHKLQPYEKSFHYIGLLKAVIRLSMRGLKASDVKDIASSITAIGNEKLKAEKDAASGRKKLGGKKKQIKVDVNKLEEDMVVDNYDEHNEYEFM